MDEVQLGEQICRIWQNIGMLEAPAHRAADVYQDWMKTVLDDPIYSVKRRNIEGDIDGIIQNLLPLRMGMANRCAFVPCENGWTAFFANGRFGADPSAISVLSKRLQCRSMRVTSTRGRAGSYSLDGTIWTVTDSAGKNIRSISAIDEGKKWIFEERGTPFEFENIEYYKKRIIRHRFNHDILVAYLANFGIKIDDMNYFSKISKDDGGIVFSKHGGNYNDS